jgi:two-component system response regulator DegU
MPETTVRLLICEDQTLLRESLRTVLSLEPGFVVVGEAADGAEAVQRAAETRPDVILMDVKMPRVSGIAATAAIVTRDPQARVVMLTTFDDDATVFQAVEAGAMGYLLKSIPATDLIAAITRVMSGEAIMSPGLAQHLLDTYRQHGRLTRHAAPEAAGEDLSEREREVLQLLARGASNHAIAEDLVLAEGTVKNYVSTILLKLHAANRTHAAMLARERGLV